MEYLLSVMIRLNSMRRMADVEAALKAVAAERRNTTVPVTEVTSFFLPCTTLFLKLYFAQSSI